MGDGRWEDGRWENHLSPRFTRFARFARFARLARLARSTRSTRSARFTGSTTIRRSLRRLVLGTRLPVRSTSTAGNGCGTYAVSWYPGIKVSWYHVCHAIHAARTRGVEITWLLRLLRQSPFDHVIHRPSCSSPPSPPLIALSSVPPHHLRARAMDSSNTTSAPDSGFDSRSGDVSQDVRAWPDSVDADPMVENQIGQVLMRAETTGVKQNVPNAVNS